MTSRRRLLVSAVAALASAGCGFQLRQPPRFAFTSIQVLMPTGSMVGDELRRNLAAAPSIRVLEARAPGPQAAAPAADVVFELLSEQRQKVVVGLNAAGQVREFQLRSSVSFRLRTPRGRELIPLTELLQQRDISFNESAVLAREAEEGLLYRDMQTDLVQQLLRRLAAVRTV
jgi:LPS-assembly lipoprotein